MNDDTLGEFACTVYHAAMSENPGNPQDALRRTVALVSSIRGEWSASDALWFVKRKVRPH